MWTVIVDLVQPGFHILCDATTQVYLQPLSSSTLLYSGAPSKFYLGKDITGVKPRGFSGRLSNLKIWQRGLVVPRYKWHSDSSTYYTDYNNVNEVGDLYYGERSVSLSNLILDAPLQGGLWEFTSNNHFVAVGSGVGLPIDISVRGPTECNSKILDCTTTAGCTNFGARDETIYGGTPPYIYTQYARMDTPLTLVAWFYRVGSTSLLDVHCSTVGGDSTGSGVKMSVDSNGYVLVKGYQAGSPSPYSETNTGTLGTGWQHLHLVVPFDGHHFTIYVNGAIWADNTAFTNPSSATLPATMNMTCSAGTTGSGAKVYDARFYTKVNLLNNATGSVYTYPDYISVGPKNFP
jgi:hypothetical protein